MLKRPYKRWNADEVLRVLKGLKAKGEQLNSGHIARTRPALSYAARRYLGGWEDAIKAAGLDYDKIRRKNFWSKEKIVEQILALKRAGKPLNVSAAEISHGGLVGATTVYYGSWRAAIKAAGLDYTKIKKQKEWSKEEIVSEIKRMNREGLPLGTTIPVRAKYRILHAAAIRYFGSWAAAMKAAKLEKLLR
jgi:hypothetical protein